MNCSETQRGLREQLHRAEQGDREALWLREQPHGAGLGKVGDKAEDRPLKSKILGLHSQVCPAAVRPAQPLQVLVSESLLHITDNSRLENFQENFPTLKENQQK